MNEAPKETPPPAASAPPATPPGALRPEPPAHTPVRRVPKPSSAPPAALPRSAKPATSAPAAPHEPRRDFFSDAMRETLAPFAGLLERKINPILAALEALPDDVERLANTSLASMGAALDQPQTAGKGPGPKNRPVAEASADSAPPTVRFLRPPGAAPAGQFESLCTACGKCVEACPARAIRIDFEGLLAGGKPYIVPTTQPCVVCDSLACMALCPTGALTLVERLKIRMGTARVNLDLCLRENGEDCRLCLEACPIMGEGAGSDGPALVIHPQSGRVRVRRNACVGCGLCESRCPTNPPAISVEPYRAPVDPIVA